MVNYPDCVHCHRPMRSSKWKAADYPGTVQASSSGYCAACYRRFRRTNELPPKKQPRTDIDTGANMRSLMAYLAWRKPFRAKAGQS